MRLRRPLLLDTRKNPCCMCIQEQAVKTDNLFLLGVCLISVRVDAVDLDDWRALREISSDNDLWTDSMSSAIVLLSRIF